MSSGQKTRHWDKMYEMPLERIPWEIKKPPEELVEIIRNGIVSGGKALDIACGTGNYSFYLARQGFDVLGVDFSEKALEIATQTNRTLKLPVRFKFADVTRLQGFIGGEKFDFILDYSILHLDPQITGSYAQQCADALKPGGKLLLVCYSEKDAFASGGQAATGKYGNEMFYRTADEIRAAYKDLKEVYYKGGRLGKRLHHQAHCFLFENPSARPQ